jgi:hypothetical protein
MDPAISLESSEDTTAFFLELFRGHGLPCCLRDGWIVADDGCLTAQVRIFTISSTGNRICIHLDLDVRLPTGQSLLESCAGVGGTRSEAIADAIRNIADGSFHVIFLALTGRSCSHCEIESWRVGEVERQVFISPMVCRGHAPLDDPFFREWFSTMQEAIQATGLAPGIHWIRLYQFKASFMDPVSEALLDNDDWPEIQRMLARLSWPPADWFYSVRIFLLMKDAAAGGMLTSSWA